MVGTDIKLNQAQEKALIMELRQAGFEEPESYVDEFVMNLDCGMDAFEAANSAGFEPDYLVNVLI